MRYTNDLAMDAVAVSSTDTVTSSWIDSSSMFQISVQAVAAGSNPNGTLKIQFSNDNPTAGSPTHASDITSASVSIANNGTFAIQKTDICAQYIRLSYTNSSGSGTLSARIKTNGY